VLLDYSLPAMNGIEVLKNIRNLHPFLPVILLTGQGNEAIAVEAIKEGAYDYLVKSQVSSEKLNNIIKVAITQSILKRNIADIKYQMQQKTLELALSEERYELAVQGMSAGLWDWNVETNELYWSKQFRDIVGVSSEKFRPHYDEFVNRLHPDDRDATITALNNHINDRTIYNVEYRLRCEDGNYVWLQACGQAKWNEDGIPVRMVGSVNNISERKKLEIEREDLIEKLTESNSELERFAYICSHDLQEPLRMISSFTQLLEKHSGGEMDDRSTHYMQYIKDGAAQARRLINDVLNYARVDHESEMLADVDCETILKNVLHDLSPRIEETGAKITSGRLPTVHLQATHLRQLLQNLIGNALKFCTTAPQIDINVKDDGEFYCFSVRDNGIGIAHEHMQKIFAIFQRLHSREHYPGTGIGLALCKKLVQKYGGEIWVESEPGKGSCFYFTLPKEAQAAEVGKSRAA
jgi:PAS domain S-box-containing protein